MKQYQWMPADSGNWFEIDPDEKYDDEEREHLLLETLKGPKRQTEGAKVRWREVGEWQEYKRPVDPAMVLYDLKAYLMHNPSSTFGAGELQRILEDFETGKLKDW